ncbi:MAG TPA: helix-turn-helix transcriptional regulator [Actinocrinis sp.]|nr:helix-turn-helix transcriptional regulator [Actinocrinis sp.]
MGRRELDLDPAAGPVEGFAHDLRALRRKADIPSYRELARRAHYSASALSTAANGRVLPSLALIEAYVKACGGDETEWRRRWHEINDLRAGESVRGATPAGSRGADAEHSAPPEPAARRGLRSMPRRVAVTASITAGVLGAGAVAAAMMTSGPGSDRPVGTPSLLASDPIEPGTACGGGELAPLPPSGPAGLFQAGGRITFSTASPTHPWRSWWHQDNALESVTNEQTYDGNATLRVEVAPGFTAIGSTSMQGLRPGDVVTVRLAYFGQGTATICPFVQNPKYAESWVRVRELDLDTRSTPGWQTYQWTIPAMTVIGTGVQIDNPGLSNVVLYIGQITW